MRIFIISVKIFFISLTVTFIIIPVIYSFRHDYMTTMQIFKKCWHDYLIAGISFILAVFFKSMEEDY